MKIDEKDSDEVILRELGKRIARHRLNQNLTQAELSNEAGISLSTVQRTENGQTVQTTTLIRILRALGIVKNLEALIPQPAISPIQQLKRHGEKRRRASSESSTTKEETPWTWGDEE